MNDNAQQNNQGKPSFANPKRVLTAEQEAFVNGSFEMPVPAINPIPPTSSLPSSLEHLLQPVEDNRDVDIVDGEPVTQSSGTELVADTVAAETQPAIEASAPAAAKQVEDKPSIGSIAASPDPFRSNPLENQAESTQENEQSNVKSTEARKARGRESFLENANQSLVTLSGSQKETLRKTAFERRRSEAAILREALDDWFKKHNITIIKA